MLTVRKLHGKERFDAQLISAYCFHRRDIEAEREKCENRTEDDWGAFTEDGKIIARIINNRFAFYIDGQTVTAGGIGAVSTLPEYRSSGAISAIFKSILEDAYQNGEVVSALYPFNHSFYGKQGYEIVPHSNKYTFSPAALSLYRFDKKITRYTDGDDITPYKRIYDAFAKNFNFSAQRTDERMKEAIGYKNLFGERKFSYLFTDENTDIAYLTFTDVYHNPGAILSVNECAWINKDGFAAILAFLTRFQSDYERIELTLPMGIDLVRIVKTRDTYDITKTGNINFMARVIHVPKMLEVLKKDEPCDFIIKVSDTQIAQNTGVYRVTNEKVTKIDDSRNYDVAVSERSFSQLALGGIGFEEALLRDDVELKNQLKFGMLNRVFAQKKIFVSEHF